MSMSAATCDNSEKSKRKLDQENRAERSNAKRARVEAITTKTQPMFHECHLIMLQSLYQDNNNDELVTSETWNQAKSFLKQRPILLTKQKEQQDLQDIHHAAIEYVVKQSQSKQPDFKPSLSLHTSQPPNQLQSPTVSIFSPLGTSPAPSKRQHQPRCSLALVARLLGRRAAIQENKQPFSSLKTQVVNCVAKLETSLQSLRRKRLEQDRRTLQNLTYANDTDESVATPAVDQDCNKIVTIEAKISLWNILLHSLRQVE